jgi:periplasmic divalent cation tolerance protein
MWAVIRTSKTMPTSNDSSSSQAIVIALTTLDDPQAAESLATALVERNLAACCQIVGPIKSMYRWKGKLEQSAEYQVWIKTRRDCWSELELAVHELHPYEVPQLLLFEITAASELYSKWLHEQLDAK